MSIDERNIPLFLGVSRRAARRDYELDLIGLSTMILFPFFPQNLTAWQLVMGIHRSLLAAPGDYSFKVLLTDDSDPTKHAWVDCNFFRQSQETQPIMSFEQPGIVIPPVTLARLCPFSGAG